MSIPRFLIDMLENQYGKEIAKKIIQGYSSKRKVSIRVNTLKTDCETIKNKLKNVGIDIEEVEWSKEALIIKNAIEKDIQKFDIYKNGEIYVQNLSSMIPPIVLKPKPNLDILDMTAAPGSKTTQIAALTQNKSNITACEMNKVRTERLKYNIEKQGANSVYVMIKDARQIDDFFSFDQILLDSPCSGSGTLNIEDKKLNNTFTTKLIQKVTIMQLALLKKAIAILKPGQEMVYSTCSILECENEETVKKVLKEKEIEIVPIQLKGIENLPLLPTKIEGTLCISPNDLYEGFFIAKIRKKA